MPVSVAELEPTSSTAGEDLRLLVSFPALNEEATIAQVIAATPRDVPGIQEIRILVVDDGSTDRTAALAAEAGADLIHHEAPRGVGAAFRSALTYAIEQGVDLLVTIDADGQFNPADIPKLIAPVVSRDADFATASRFKDPSLTPRMPWIKRWGNRQMSRLISRLTGHRFDDVTCGMRCYNRRAMLSLNLMGAFTYTQEVFLNLAFKQLRIVEMPMVVRGEREFGESRVASSILRYALNTSRIIFRAYRDYYPMRFFGAIAVGLMVPALLLGGFLVAHYFVVGAFTPYKWTGFAALGFAVLALVFVHMGLIGDMLNRHRIYLEELLYYTRLAGGQEEAKHTSTRVVEKDDSKP